jgi:hypothetical protein
MFGKIRLSRLDVAIRADRLAGSSVFRHRLDVATFRTLSIPRRIPVASQGITVVADESSGFRIAPRKSSLTTKAADAKQATIIPSDFCAAAFA